MDNIYIFYIYELRYFNSALKKNNKKNKLIVSTHLNAYARPLSRDKASR